MLDWWHEIEPVIDLLFEDVILLAIAYVLALKAVLLRRITPLGRWLARQNFWFAIAYLALFLSAWVPFFRGDPWRYLIRLAILVSATLVMREMARAFGGWVALHRRAWEGVRDLMHGRPDGGDADREGY